MQVTLTRQHRQAGVAANLQLVLSLSGASYNAHHIPIVGAKAGMMNIVNVGYDSTNYYVLADKTPVLLIDTGFPGTLPKLQYQCKRSDVKFADIPYLFCTHYHPDHAGLAGELQKAGIRLI